MYGPTDLFWNPTAMVLRQEVAQTAVERAQVKCGGYPAQQAPARKAPNDRVNKRYGDTRTARRRR